MYWEGGEFCIQGDLHSVGGGLHPGERGVCIKRVGDLHSAGKGTASRGVWQTAPPPEKLRDTFNEWAVRILLEYVLVFFRKPVTSRQRNIVKFAESRSTMSN